MTMIENPLFSLGSFHCDTIQLDAGEHTVEFHGRRPVALVLVRGELRVNGETLPRFRPRTVSGTVRLRAEGPCVLGRLSVGGDDAAHLGG